MARLCYVLPRRCLGVIAVAQQRAFVLFFTLSAAIAAACLRLLCVDDVLGRATSLTAISAEAGGVVGKVWSAEQARARRVQHFLKQLLRDSGIMQQTIPVV